MLASAQRAAELETDGNTPWYAVARAALGHANYVVGDLDTAADVLKFYPLPHGNIEQAPRETGLSIRDFRWIYLYFGDLSARRNIGDRIGFLRQLNIGFFYIRVGSTHLISPFWDRF